MREQHFQPTSNQLAHERTAGQDRNQLASMNHGRPANTAMDSVNGRAYNQQGRIAQGSVPGSSLRARPPTWSIANPTSTTKSPPIAAPTAAS
jgi:hypothetical protein